MRSFFLSRSVVRPTAKSGATARHPACSEPHAATAQFWTVQARQGALISVHVPEELIRDAPVPRWPRPDASPFAPDLRGTA